MNFFHLKVYTYKGISKPPRNNAHVSGNLAHTLPDLFLGGA